MVNIPPCPKCNSNDAKRNGLSRHGQQRYKCKTCQYQYSHSPNNKVISVSDIKRIHKLLLERISLRGICRVMDVSLPWLLAHIEKLYASLPDDLNIITKGIDFEACADEKFDAMIYDYIEKKAYGSL